MEIPLTVDEGELWKNEGCIIIFMRYKNEKESMFFSYNQKTTFSKDSFDEDLYVFKECKRLFFKKVKEALAEIKIIETNTDFI